MPNNHIVSAFDQDLSELSTRVSTLGAFAGSQFADAVLALVKGDTKLAQQVIDRDAQLDSLSRDLSAAAALVIAKRQPVASDLDEVLADFRIVEDLERIGDLAKNVARRTLELEGSIVPDDLAKRMQELAVVAVEQLRRAVDSFVEGDASEAMLIRSDDESLDRLHDVLFRELVERMSNEPSESLVHVQMLFCAKNIERVGDHAANVALAACVKATGHLPNIARRRRNDP